MNMEERPNGQKAGIETGDRATKVAEMKAEFEGIGAEESATDIVQPENEIHGVADETSEQGNTVDAATHDRKQLAARAVELDNAAALLERMKKGEFSIPGQGTGSDTAGGSVVQEAVQITAPPEAVQKPGVDFEVSKTEDALANEAVQMSLELSFPTRQPAVVAALERAGVQEPRRTGNYEADRAANRTYMDAVNKMGREVQGRMFEEIRVLDPAQQAKLAEKFFAGTIGKHIGNNANAYRVYQQFKGTPFADKFRELESARLTAAGFSPLSI